MLLSVAPGYAYHFNHDWIDKVGLALRFDYVQGIFANSATAANYLETTSYKSSKGYMSSLSALMRKMLKSKKILSVTTL